MRWLKRANKGDEGYEGNKRQPFLALSQPFVSPL
jgi:hypothetical protein